MKTFLLFRLLTVWIRTAMLLRKRKNSRMGPTMKTKRKMMRRKITTKRRVNKVKNLKRRRNDSEIALSVG